MLYTLDYNVHIKYVITLKKSMLYNECCLKKHDLCMTFLIFFLHFKKMGKCLNIVLL